MRKAGAIILATLVALFAAASTTTAGTMGLAWDAVSDSDLAGYRVYYGTSPGNYSSPPVDVGNQTQTTLTGLDACTVYYTAIKAYDTGGLESTTYSNELSGLPRPVVGSTSPASAEQGATLTVSVYGESFDSAASVEFGGTGITVSSVTYVSCTELSVDITIDAGAAAGARDVTVVNPDNTYGTLAGAFTVSANAAPSVSSASPADGASGVDVAVQPSVTFSEAMDAASVTSSTVRLLDDGGQPVSQAAGSPQLSADGLTATITPAADLAYDATYQLHVVGGASGVQDASGQTMASDWQQATGFTTSSAPDTQGPSVVSTTPADGATDVSVSVQPQVTFDEQVDGSTVTASTVLLVDALGAPVPQAAGSPSLSTNKKTVTITPAAALDESAAYRIRVVGGSGGVADLAGNPLDATFEQAAGFTTENLPPGAVTNQRRTDVR